MSSRSFARAVNRKIQQTKKIEEEPIVFDLSTYEVGEEGEPVLDRNGRPIMVDGEPLLAKPLDNGHDGPLLDENGEQVIGVLLRQDVFHARRPGEDAMIVSLIQGGRSTATFADRAGTVFDLFEQALPANEYRTLLARVKNPDDEVDISMLRQIFDWLEEEWTTFPTKSASDSSPQQPQSGKNSTGRSPSKRASTPSTSLSNDS